MTLKSDTDTEFALVSSTNKLFNFNVDTESGKSTKVDMLRFAELDSHIVIAQASRNSTEPFQLTITVEVVKDLRQVEYIETNSDGTAIVRQ